MARRKRLVTAAHNALFALSLPCRPRTTPFLGCCSHDPSIRPSSAETGGALVQLRTTQHALRMMHDHRDVDLAPSAFSGGARCHPPGRCLLQISRPASQQWRPFVVQRISLLALSDEPNCAGREARRIAQRQVLLRPGAETKEHDQ